MIAIAAIGTIGVIETVALVCGHNGQMLLSVVGAIGAITGGAIGYGVSKKL